MKKIFYAFLILVFISCTNSKKNKVDEIKSQVKDSLSNNDQSNKVIEFETFDTSNQDLSSLDHEGKIVNKRIWQDTNGENIILFTQKENELFLYHYAINSDNIKLLRRIYDFEKDCEYDLTIEFIENSIAVTDIDNNNLGEITFAYKKACISDLSPLELKLIILENGNKYIIRGTTLIDMGEEKIGGDKNIDPSFEKAPANFLSHANKIWSAIVK